MSDKLADTRFTLQFSRTDPSHLQVDEILNRQGRRSKAQYIVNAVLHYENCGENPSIQRPYGFDEKVIAAVVYRILRDQTDNNAGKPDAAVPSSGQAKKPVLAAEDISYDEAAEALGEDGLNAVAGALDMFRQK